MDYDLAVHASQFLALTAKQPIQPQQQNRTNNRSDEACGLPLVAACAKEFVREKTAREGAADSQPNGGEAAHFVVAWNQAACYRTCNQSKQTPADNVHPLNSIE